MVIKENPDRKKKDSQYIIDNIEISLAFDRVDSDEENSDEENFDEENSDEENLKKY